MSLKKPSQLFGEEKIPSEKKSNSLAENFTETLNKFKSNVSVIEELNSKISHLSEEITGKITKSDLDNAMISHLMVVDENIQDIRAQIKTINKNDLLEFKRTSKQLTETVDFLIKDQFPKYKKKIINTELKVEEKIDDLREEVVNLHQSSSKELQEKFENFADVVDNNFLIFNQTIQETKENVNETVETYKKLYKIVESKGQKENKKLEEYSQVLEDFNAKFLGFKSYIEEQIKVYETVNLTLDEKLSSFESDLSTWKEETKKDILNFREDAIGNILEFKEDIKSDISSLKADASIFDSRNKKLGNEISDLQEETQSKLKLIESYINNHHYDVEKLKEEICNEVNNATLGNIQENIYRLNRKLSYIEKVYNNINPEDIVNEVISENLTKQSSSKSKDPLTPLDKNYVTVEQLQQHYRLFINRIQQQLSTLGGGGEVQLKYLDDIVGIATNPSIYDGQLLQYNHSIGKFQFVAFGEKNVIYVAKNGNDNNDGSLMSPKLTIKSAVNDVVSAGHTDRVIKVAPGTYIEDNPISLPNELSIIGYSLRETTIIPQNDDQDLFYVGNGNYISDMSFRGSLPNKAIISFDPTKPRYINQSPYIQNCTNFIPESIGMRIDGNAAIGPLKSMVLDSYTQYNQGGIGVSITNQGYSQLVSLFTICNEIAVYCGSGSACDLSNSNSSFGDYGLIADSVSPLKFTGIATVTSSELSDTFVVYFDTPVLNVTNALYDNSTGLTTITVDSNHNFNVGMGVTISGLEFTSTSVSGISAIPFENTGYVFDVQRVVSPNSFEVYVGVSTYQKTYVSGGTCSVNVVRPYDGHNLYFNDLFYTVKTLNITNGGSYTTLPTVTIDPPSTSWGITAEAFPIIENGVLVGVDMISNGRGYTSIPNVTISSGINTATAIAELTPEYYTINKSTDIVNNTCIITLNENVPFTVGIGTEVKFFKQSRILATGHSFEFIGSGTDISNAIPFIGGNPPNDNNETDSRNGGLVVYTSTNQSGNFKIGDGVTISQNSSTITGQAYQKSLIASITPYVLSLGGGF